MEVTDAKIKQVHAKPVRIYFDPNYLGSHLMLAQGKKVAVHIGREALDEVIAVLQKAKQSLEQ